jgi:DNA-binding beta-propeller fold protein YncE
MRGAWLLFALACSVPARAELAVVALSDEQRLDDGTQVVPAHPQPDRVAVVAFGPGELRRVATIAAPASVIGPPGSVAVTPDGRHALVTDARRIDPADSTRIVPSDIVTLIALMPAPHVVATLHVGAGASGVAIDPSGRLALVASRAGNSVSLLALDGDTMRLADTLPVGPGTSPAQPAFFDAGRRALVTRDGDHRVSILSVADGHLRMMPDTIVAGLRPYALSAAGGHYAATATMAGAGRDVDSLTLIDMAGSAPRAVDSVGVGLTPEGVAMSPDGRFVAVTVNNGSNDPRAALGYHGFGLLQVWAITGGHLVKRAEARMGGWGQGVAWSRDGRELIAEAMVEQRLESWRFDGRALVADRMLPLGEGPAGLGVAP